MCLVWIRLNPSTLSDIVISTNVHTHATRTHVQIYTLTLLHARGSSSASAFVRPESRIAWSNTSAVNMYVTHVRHACIHRTCHVCVHSTCHACIPNICHVCVHTALQTSGHAPRDTCARSAATRISSHAHDSHRSCMAHLRMMPCVRDLTKLIRKCCKRLYGHRVGSVSYEGSLVDLHAVYGRNVLEPPACVHVS